MQRHVYFLFLLILFSLMLTGCKQTGSSQSIVNSHAEALLTKNNELQFRFKINDKILSGEKLYKVKVTIHNAKLASALGTSEIIYGSDVKFTGAYIEVNNHRDNFIFMNPIPLLKDLHVFEIEEMIMNEDAVSVEVFNDKQVIAKAFLTNFSSQL
ncbi:hypothetical protein RRV45_08345 [Bacillus sp. DTU_2020_1000418_1_SI_GHA_SEK_038]|uniref:hypothetical protein n=1 Tax=Bacillus sp. DTU_2020_1000418_1_SI_GHA_SEK_038 TaxID=3077585 RepID=UPI0028E76EE0|nr:hypothetical protein [Bacillus sp. DTU_2020_1000418_1_SI_GHA_SEK_038]WNS76978.1 hypothetical protein RRV45_08345 [Bacillus sp. DTU_2020_1000418_1_SI_GHA_SEK_038]